MGKLFKDLKKGLQEIIAHKQGKITLKSELVEIPAIPKHDWLRKPTINFRLQSQQKRGKN